MGFDSFDELEGEQWKENTITNGSKSKGNSWKAGKMHRRHEEKME